jgi:hypothetical protein
VLLGCPDGISKSPDLKAKNNKKKGRSGERRHAENTGSVWLTVFLADVNADVDLL